MKSPGGPDLLSWTVVHIMCLITFQEFDLISSMLPNISKHGPICVEVHWTQNNWMNNIQESAMVSDPVTLWQPNYLIPKGAD